MGTWTRVKTMKRAAGILSLSSFGGLSAGGAVEESVGSFLGSIFVETAFGKALVGVAHPHPNSREA